MKNKNRSIHLWLALVLTISMFSDISTGEAAQGDTPNNVCNCKGYAGVGGPCYAGVGGPAYAGVGGPAYDGVGGPAYDGVGGPCYAGVGGPCYSGIGGSGKSCPAICK